MNPKVILCAALTAFAITLFLWVYTPAALNPPKVYGGRILLATVAEYNEFKKSIADPEVEITKLFELSSSLPALVEFEVKVPGDHTFAYGTYMSEWFVCVYVLLGLAVCGFFVGFGVILYWRVA